MPGVRSFTGLRWPRLPYSRLSAFSRTAQVLNTTTSGVRARRGGRVAGLVEQAADALAVVDVHLAPVGAHLVRPALTGSSVGRASRPAAAVRQARRHDRPRRRGPVRCPAAARATVRPREPSARSRTAPDGARLVEPSRRRRGRPATRAVARGDGRRASGCRPASTPARRSTSTAGCAGSRSRAACVDDQLDGRPAAAGCSSDGEPRPLTPDTGGARPLLPAAGGARRAAVPAGACVDAPAERRATTSCSSLDGGEPHRAVGRQRLRRRPAAVARRPQLAFLTWEHPRMPWDGTELRVAPLRRAGAGKVRVVLGGPDEAVFQPEWDEGGLRAVTDPAAGGTSSGSAAAPLWAVERSAAGRPGCPGTPRTPRWPAARGGRARPVRAVAVGAGPDGQVRDLELPFTTWAPVLGGRGTPGRSGSPADRARPRPRWSRSTPPTGPWREVAGLARARAGAGRRCPSRSRCRRRGAAPTYAHALPADQPGAGGRRAGAVAAAGARRPDVADLARCTTPQTRLLDQPRVRRRRRRPRRLDRPRPGLPRAAARAVGRAPRSTTARPSRAGCSTPAGASAVVIRGGSAGGWTVLSRADPRRQRVRRRGVLLRRRRPGRDGRDDPRLRVPLPRRPRSRRRSRRPRARR